jgi:hypothetical protein
MLAKLMTRRLPVTFSDIPVVSGLLLALLAVGSPALASETSLIELLNQNPGVRIRADQLPPQPAVSAATAVNATQQQGAREVYIRANPDGSIPAAYRNPPAGVTVHVVPSPQQ